jgi:hypothetical protein
MKEYGAGGILMNAFRVATASIFLIADFISPIFATGDMSGCPDCNCGGIYHQGELTSRDGLWL